MRFRMLIFAKEKIFFSRHDFLSQRLARSSQPPRLVFFCLNHLELVLILSDFRMFFQSDNLSFFFFFCSSLSISRMPDQMFFNQTRAYVCLFQAKRNWSIRTQAVVARYQLPRPGTIKRREWLCARAIRIISLRVQRRPESWTRVSSNENLWRQYRAKLPKSRPLFTPQRPPSRSSLCRQSPKMVSSSLPL